MDASENGIVGATSPAQLRAARGLVDWSLDKLAVASGVPKRTLIRMEGGSTKTRSKAAASVRAALEAAGVEFIAENGGGVGVRLRSSKAPHQAP